MLPMVLLLTGGAAAPFVGWILDHVDARPVIAIGIFATGVGLLAASRINSFAALFAVYVILGLGHASAGYVPATVVITNWFKQRRGATLGLAMCGGSIGGALMVLWAGYVTSRAGWRAAT